MVSLVLSLLGSKGAAPRLSCQLGGGCSQPQGKHKDGEFFLKEIFPQVLLMFLPAQAACRWPQGIPSLSPSPDGDLLPCHCEGLWLSGEG